MAWCLHCRDSLEALTLIDSPADPASRHLLATQEWKLAQASFCSQLRRLDLHNVCFDFQDGLHCRCAFVWRLFHLATRHLLLSYPSPLTPHPFQTVRAAGALDAAERCGDWGGRGGAPVPLFGA